MITSVFVGLLGYVGPGTGLSLGAALIGVIVALFASIGLTLLWPLRILIRKLRGRHATCGELPKERCESAREPNSSEECVSRSHV